MGNKTVFPVRMVFMRTSEQLRSRAGATALIRHKRGGALRWQI